MTLRRLRYTDHAIESNGAVDAYRPVLLDGSGKLDDSFLPTSITVPATGMVQMATQTAVVANDGTFNFPAKKLGFLWVINSTSGSWWSGVMLGGSNNVTQLNASSGTSTTKDNAGTLNIYYDATDARYEIQNKTGGSVNLGIFLIVRSP